jgi:hypothetical protein
MRILAGGNVGIGTTSPSNKLTVVGIPSQRATVIGDAGFGTNYAGLSVQGTLTTANYSLLGDGTNLFINRPNGGDMFFRMNNADQMVLTNSGNVGIGTTTPGVKLQVQDGSVWANSSSTLTSSMLTNDGGVELYRHPTATIAPATNGYVDFKDNAADDYDARIYYSNPSGVGFNPNGAFVIETTTNGQPATASQRLVIRNDNGYVGIGVNAPTYRLELPNIGSADGQGRAFAWPTYSDARVKSQLKPIEGLSVVMKLNPLSYKHHDAEKTAKGLLIKDSGSTSFGFIAQELYKVLPEIVYKPLDDKNDFWSVDYDKLIPFLTKAIQEQQAIIETLQKQLNEKETNYKALIEKQHDLEKQMDVLMSQIKAVLELQNTSNK